MPQVGLGFIGYWVKGWGRENENSRMTPRFLAWMDGGTTHQAQNYRSWVGTEDDEVGLEHAEFEVPDPDRYLGRRSGRQFQRPWLTSSASSG